MRVLENVLARTARSRPLQAEKRICERPYRGGGAKVGDRAALYRPLLRPVRMGHSVRRGRLPSSGIRHRRHVRRVRPGASARVPARIAGRSDAPREPVKRRGCDRGESAVPGVLEVRDALRGAVAGTRPYGRRRRPSWQLPAQALPEHVPVPAVLPAAERGD